MARRPALPGLSRAASPTRTATATATCRASPRHLDHLARLGVTGVWLNPIHPSPNRDWGYDVADYTAVHPELGTLADFDELVAEAGAARASGSCSTSSRTTPPTSTPGSRPRSPRRRAPTATTTSGRMRQPTEAHPTTGSRCSAGPPGRSMQASGQYYLHNFTSRAARPELVERGAARGVRPHPALLARARRRRLPRRRLPRDRQGPAAARQPARDRRRSPERACPRASRRSTT